MLRAGRQPDPEHADIAIEVEWTRGAVDKMDVYRKLGVREVWIWNQDKIDVFSLRGESYASIDGSELLTGLDFRQLLRFIDIRPMTRAVTEYRAALRRA